jgi:hypothetical protein
MTRSAQKNKILLLCYATLLQGENVGCFRLARSVDRLSANSTMLMPAQQETPEARRLRPLTRNSTELLDDSNNGAELVPDIGRVLKQDHSTLPLGHDF